jgi:hypothetical protein
LSYSKKQGKTSKAAIHVLTAVVHAHKKNPLRFDIDAGRGGVLRLRALDVNERNQWLTNLKKTQELLGEFINKRDAENDPFLALRRNLQKAQYYRKMMRVHLNLLQRDKAKKKTLGLKGDEFIQHAQSFYNVSQKIMSATERVAEIHIALANRRLEESLHNPTKKKPEVSGIVSKNANVIERTHSRPQLDNVSISSAQQNTNANNDMSESDSVAYFSPELGSEESCEYFSADTPKEAVETKENEEISSEKQTQNFLEHISTNSKNTVKETEKLNLDSLNNLFTVSVDETLAEMAQWQKGPHRLKLPADEPKTSTASLFKLLKNLVGKELDTMDFLPIEFYEPLTTLQKLAESIEYSELLDFAAGLSDPTERLLYVAGFAVSSYANTHNRIHKPLSSFVGETYELVDIERGLRLLCEHIRQRPQLSVMQVDSIHKWQIFTSLGMTNKFNGRSLEVIPRGKIHVIFTERDDHFVWNRVRTVVTNLIIGRKNIYHEGEMQIVNRTTGDKCALQFHKPESGAFRSDIPQIQGKIYDQHEKLLYCLHGQWNSELIATPIRQNPSARNEKEQEGAPFIIWRANPLPAVSLSQYHFTQFAFQLNELMPKVKEILPPTDSRFRKDVRYLEEGAFVDAEREKKTFGKHSSNAISWVSFIIVISVTNSNQ